jgi:hypothetical protein
MTFHNLSECTSLIMRLGLTPVEWEVFLHCSN